MRCKHALYTFFVISPNPAGILALLLSVFVSGADAACSVTIVDAIGAKAAQELRTRIVNAERKFRPANSVVADELAYTATETLPLLRRADLLNPVRPKPRIYVDAYFGDGIPSTPDRQVMKLDERLLCILQPGRAVFLSDNATHHYALVYSIDYKARKVTLLDPWASKSFLLGANFIDVRARYIVGKRGEPLLELTFEEFLRALRGTVEGFMPEMFFAGIEDYYPEIADSETFLVWKYSRLLATDSFQVSFPTVVELTSRKDLTQKPKLQVLANWANDYIVGVLSGFSTPKPGFVADRKDIPRLREEFIGRLDQYAKELPWPLKWLLLQRTFETQDMDLRLTILDSFLRLDASDIDFQIARAETLLRQERHQDAVKQLDIANEQWRADLLTVISKPNATEAETFLIAKDYGLQSLAVLQWRYVRIQLYRHIGALLAGTVGDQEHTQTIDRLQRRYLVGSLFVDFLPELMWANSLAKTTSLQDIHIRTIVGLRKDPERVEHFGIRLYQSLASRTDISAFDQATLTALRASAVGERLCGYSELGRRVFDYKEEHGAALKKFCRRPISKTSKSPTLPDSHLVQQAIRYGSRTARENSYCGSFFAFSLDREH